MTTRNRLLAALATISVASGVAAAGSVPQTDPCDQMRQQIERGLQNLPACPDPRGETPAEHY